ncbi:MAG: glycosyltransferase [Candidatus Omnitrophica bacterium]|nr:glycosyltransferase [Candidatus Omnitrophota bacterium]
MKILFDNKNNIPPKISIVLLDWSCRESFHSLDYLNNQTVSREQYEIIWIEYYSRRSPEIEVKLKECERLGKPPIIDRWIAADMPDNVCSHKHLMYNIGIAASKGEIICFCDSDAVFSPTFVESIIKAFEADRNIVLQIDEVRNIDKRFYPFKYPAIEEILGGGCINWKDDRTIGLLDKEDPLHTRNYGACMCALRQDLISIGGADEHIDYLGHICGPYEMTFRLVNYGKKEIWHQGEFIYHVWHPGTDGKDNYLGPHDGKNMSTTALDIIKTGRSMSFVENPAIRALRLNRNYVIANEELITFAVTGRDVNEWSAERLRVKKRRENTFFKYLRNYFTAATYVGLLWKQVSTKMGRALSSPNPLRYIFNKIYKIPAIMKNMVLHNSNIYERCGKAIQDIVSRGITEISICGTGDEARVLYKLIDSRLKVKAVFDLSNGKTFFNHNIASIEEIKNYNDIFVVTNLNNANEILGILKKMDVPKNNIIVI